MTTKTAKAPKKSNAIVETMKGLYLESETLSATLHQLQAKKVDLAIEVKDVSYRLADNWTKLTTTHREEFVAYIKASGDTLTNLMDQWFRPVEAFNVDHFALVSAVTQGMTRADYGKMKPRAWLDALPKKPTWKPVEVSGHARSKPSHDTLGEKPAAQADDMATLRKVNWALNVQLEHAKAEIANLTKQIARLIG